jgi:hypothetical protein
VEEEEEDAAPLGAGCRVQGVAGRAISGWGGGGGWRHHLEKAGDAARVEARPYPGPTISIDRDASELESVVTQGLRGRGARGEPTAEVRDSLPHPRSLPGPFPASPRSLPSPATRAAPLSPSSPPRIRTPQSHPLSPRTPREAAGSPGAGWAHLSS